MRRRGRVAEEGTRVGCVEHEEEAWSISYTNTLRALQMQAQMDDKYKHKHKQEEDEGVRELKGKLVP